MRATATVANLVAAMERSARALGRGGVHVLSGFHLEVTDRLVVTANDMDRIIRADVPLLTGRRRGVVVAGPGRKIMQAIKTLPRDDEVTLETKDDKLVITSGRTTLKFDLYRIDDYPRFPSLQHRLAVVQTEAFHEAYEYVANCYSVDESRPVLCGVKLELEDGRLRMIATDSYKLGCVEVAADVDASTEVIVRGAALADVDRLAKKSEQVEIHRSDVHVWFMADGVTLISRRIDGQFPDWNNLRPEDFRPGATTPIKFSLNRSQALSSLHRINKIGRNNTPVRVALAPKADSVKMSLLNHEEGSIEETVAATVACKERVEVGLNPGFFHDALATAQGDEVHLRLISPLRPVFISGNDADDPDRWTIVMPMKPTGLYGPIDRQRQVLAREWLYPNPCPNCEEPMPVVDAIHVDGDDFVCSRCEAKLRFIVPIVRTGPVYWIWQLAPHQIPGPDSQATEKTGEEDS